MICSLLTEAKFVRGSTKSFSDAKKKLVDILRLEYLNHMSGTVHCGFSDSEFAFQRFFIFQHMSMKKLCVVKETRIIIYYKIKHNQRHK